MKTLILSRIITGRRFVVSAIYGGLLFFLTLSSIAGENTKSVAILKFYNSQNQAHADGEKLGMLIFAKFAEHPAVRMIERENINKILAERKLTASSMTSEKKSLQLGAMLGADFILSGRIYAMDGRVYFSAKLINCRNAVVNGIVESYPEKMNRDEMLEAFAGKAAAQIIKTLGTEKNGK